MAKIKTTDKSGLYAQVSIEADGDIIFMTVAKYKLFMAHGKAGRLAKDVYEHLMFTARLQGTGTVRASENYIRNALEIGEDSYKAAKKLLIKLGLVENIIRRNESGKIIGHYVRVKAAASPLGSQEVVSPEAENQPEAVKPTGWEKPATGETPPKCFTEQDKCFTEQSKALSPVGDSAQAPAVVTAKTREGSLHHQTIDFISRAHHRIHGAPLVVDPKEAKHVKTMIELAEAECPDDPKAVIERRLRICLRKMETATTDYWADMKFTPSKIRSRWNELTPDLPKMTNAERAIRENELRVSDIPAVAAIDSAEEKNRRELLALLEEAEANVVA